MLSNDLCPSCQALLCSESYRRNLDLIRGQMPHLFDRMVRDLVQSRFGMSKPTQKDWELIGRITGSEREQFIEMSRSIKDDRFVCGVRYNPSLKITEKLYSNWECLLSPGGGGGFVDGLATSMSQCVAGVVRKLNIYCDAEIAIRAGRYEDAARAYEHLTMYEEAGRLRKMAMSERNTSRNISVNMNQLIDQVRQGGLALAYKCPNCGGSINIDKDFNPGMRMCAYCGTPLDTTVIASMIRSL